MKLYKLAYTTLRVRLRYQPLPLQRQSEPQYGSCDRQEGIWQVFAGKVCFIFIVKPLHQAVNQAGAYACRYSERIGFRQRSETAEIAVELSLQPWWAFKPDGVIMFSDILTPLPALGIEFDVVRGKGPMIEMPIRRYLLHAQA